MYSSRYRKWVIFVLGILIPLVALPESNPSTDHPFGTITYTGSGCPHNSVAITITPDALTLLFDSYFVEDGPFIPRNMRRKSCSIKVPIHVKPGQQVSIESIDYRGLAKLEEGTHGSLWSNFWLGSRIFGASRSTVFRGPIEDDILRRDSIRSRSRWSPCGRDIILRLYNRMWVHSHGSSQGAIFLDSLDGVIQFKVLTQGCS